MELTKFTLFVGLNDKDSKQQDISTINAYKIVSNLITSDFGGGTISEATGIYKHEDGTIVTEITLRIELLFTTAEKVKNLVQDLKRVLNQESIAVQKDVVSSELW